MRKTAAIFFLVFLVVYQSMSQTLITGTFNIRYDNQNDSGNLWKDRAPVAAALIRFHEFDIIGTQEGLENQLMDLQNALPEYSRYGIGRDDGKSAGEHSAIFYKKEKFIVKDSGDFWLSEHPDHPGFGWDAKHNRICSWLKLIVKSSGRSFFVFNVHYDHQGVEARRESSKLILQKIRMISRGRPVILTGDFNGNNQKEWYIMINSSPELRDALLQVQHPYINNGSFNSFRAFNPSDEIIDHIFISQHFRVKRYGVLTDSYHGRFPSDHFPVLAELMLR